MRWHWFLLLVGFGIYGLSLFPGILPHEADSPIAILAGMIFGTIAIFGFDSIHVDRRLHFVAALRASPWAWDIWRAKING